MKIIIIGAGQLGSSLAINLVREGNDITLIDTRADLLEKIEDKIDLKTIKGNGAHPSLLQLAGAEDAHMLIAVSHSDEINMVACQVAYTVFNVPKKIARIRETEYIAHKSLFSHDSMPIDVLITPEMLVSNYIQELISHPGAHKIFMFENGIVEQNENIILIKGPAINYDINKFFKPPKIIKKINISEKKDYQESLVKSIKFFLEIANKKKIFSKKENARSLVINKMII